MGNSPTSFFQHCKPKPMQQVNLSLRKHALIGYAVIAAMHVKCQCVGMGKSFKLLFYLLRLSPAKSVSPGSILCLFLLLWVCDNCNLDEKRGS